MHHIDMSGDFTVTKTGSEDRYIGGWANVAVRKDGTLVVDSDGEATTAEDLEATAWLFVEKYRETGDSHRGVSKGLLVESIVFTKEKQAALGIPEGSVPEGWWVGFRLDDPADFAKVKTGERRMFSIQGRANRTRVNAAA